MDSRANCRYVGVILVNRNFVCGNVYPGVDNRRAEFYAGKVCLEDLDCKQGVGENNICLTWYESNGRHLEW